MAFDCVSNLYVYYNEQEDLLKFAHCCIDREELLLGSLSVEDFYQLSKQELYDYIDSIVFTQSHNCVMYGVSCNCIWNIHHYKVNTVFVAISRECNLNCPMCYVKGGHKDTPKRKQLYLDFIEKLSDYDFNNLKLTDWGEPLIYINEVIEKTRQYKNCKRLSLVTNGSLLTVDVINKLLKSFDWISIELDCDSLNINNYEKIRLGAKYNTFINNMGNAIKLYNKNKDRMYLKFNCVKQQLNIKEIEAIQIFAKNQGLDIGVYSEGYKNDIYYH